MTKKCPIYRGPSLYLGCIIIEWFVYRILKCLDRYTSTRWDCGAGRLGNTWASPGVRVAAGAPDIDRTARCFPCLDDVNHTHHWFHYRHPSVNLRHFHTLIPIYLPALSRFLFIYNPIVCFSPFSPVLLFFHQFVVPLFDDNFWEKNVCHSRDSNHRSPVFRTGALTT